jgi:hypothetical protein
MTKVLLPLVVVAALLGTAALLHPTTRGGSSQWMHGASEAVLASETEPTEPTEPIPNEPTLPTQPSGTS